jgi:hypothetical protein
MTKPREQQQVRQRDRFVCQFPLCKKPGEQYAHIKPDSEGGAYCLENLVFLCYDHHNYWLEPAGTKGVRKEKLQNIANKLRDQPKEDGLYSRLFAWPAGDRRVVSLGGGVKFFNHERILESTEHPNRPYLSLRVNEFGFLVINATFEDERGNEFMTITDNELRVDTSDAWDIAVSRRRFSLIHADTKVLLNLRQNDDLDLIVTGKLFLNGGYYRINSHEIVDVPYHNRLRNNQSFNGGRGLMLQPGSIAL